MLTESQAIWYLSKRDLVLVLLVFCRCSFALDLLLLLRLCSLYAHVHHTRESGCRLGLGCFELVQSPVVTQECRLPRVARISVVCTWLLPRTFRCPCGAHWYLGSWFGMSWSRAGYNTRARRFIRHALSSHARAHSLSLFVDVGGGLHRWELLDLYCANRLECDVFAAVGS